MESYLVRYHGELNGKKNPDVDYQATILLSTRTGDTNTGKITSTPGYDAIWEVLSNNRLLPPNTLVVDGITFLSSTTY